MGKLLILTPYVAITPLVEEETNIINLIDMSNNEFKERLITALLDGPKSFDELTEVLGEDIRAAIDDSTSPYHEPIVSLNNSKIIDVMKEEDTIKLFLTKQK